jgi:hypothetical protein
MGILADHSGLVRYRDMQDDLYDFVTKTMLYKLDGILQEGRNQQGITLKSPLLLPEYAKVRNADD